MSLRHFAFALLALGLIAVRLQAADSAKPNIVVILTDDMGYSDLGCYGGEIRTPNLDKLAAGGVRYTQFYNTARCCPTRASLLTGLYPHQAGVGHMIEDRGTAGYRGKLNRNCVTLAEVLKPAGYKNYAVGKWHVTPPGADSDRSNWPLQRGFDRYYGTITGAGNYFNPATLIRGETPITAATDPDYKPAAYYYTDAITDHAVTFLADHAAKTPKDPFFMYVAYTAAHWPMHAPEDAIAEYKGFYDAGYEKFRTDRLKKMKEIGLVPADQELTPPAGDWSKVKDQAWELRCMEVYAAMVTRMDHGVGKIVAELRRTNALDDTLILFLQDNGACAENMGRAKALAAGTMPGPKDSDLAYGENWANVSNTPFREYKHWTHEGGISTPLIAHWPQGIPAARQGKLETRPGHLIDVMATCIELAKAEYPTEVAGQTIKPYRGESLLPSLTGKSSERKNMLFWEHEGNRAVRDGKWKLVAKANQPWALYDIDTDRGEMHDLAKQQPDRAKTLAAAWDEYAQTSDVLPLGGIDKSKAAKKAVPQIPAK